MKHKANPNILPDNSDPIAPNSKDTREDAFIAALMITDSVPKAAMMAGYSESYSKSAIYGKFNGKAFQDKLIDHFKAHCFTDLPTILRINKLGLSRIQRDLESGDGDLASKLKHIPRQTLEITKLLSPDTHVNTINLVNIESIQAIITGKVGTSGGGAKGTDSE